MRNFTAVWMSPVVQSCSPVWWSSPMIETPQKAVGLVLSLLTLHRHHVFGQICSPEYVAVKLLEQTIGHNFAKRALQSVLVLLVQYMYIQMQSCPHQMTHHGVCGREVTLGT